MRLAYITQSIAPYVIGGMQAVGRMHVDELAARDWEVHLIFSDLGYDAMGGRFAQVDREQVVPWPARSGVLRRIPGHYPGDLKRFSRLAGERALALNPDVIYAEGPVAWWLLQQPRYKRPPIVFHPHGLEPFQNLGRWIDRIRARPLRPLLRFHARFSDLVISQGGELTRILERSCGTPRERIAILPNAIRLANTNPVPKQRGDGPLRLLFVGRDEPRKGLRFLLRALRDCPGTTLDVVGPPGPRHTISAASDTIRWHGLVRERDRIEALYAASDVFVLPSLAEGFPTVLLEAMAHGLPVIATRVGAVPEPFSHGDIGSLISPGSATQLTSAIKDAADMAPTTYGERSATAIAVIRQEYSRTVVCNRLAGLLRHLGGNL